MAETGTEGPVPDRQQVAVVTGAGSGIGRAVAALLADRSWTVHAVDRRDVSGHTATIRPHRADVTRVGQLQRVADDVGGGGVDALVCAAGVWDQEADGRFDRLDLAAWETTLQVNLTGTLLSLRAFLPALGEQSSVVTFGSIAALVGFPNRDAYTASKGAVVALTRAWAVELAPRRIRVNCVCPGVTRTPMTEQALATQSIELPGGQPADASEISEVVAFLCSRNASYVSGAIVPVDAGFTAAAPGLPFAAPRTGSG